MTTTIQIHLCQCEAWQWRNGIAVYYCNKCGGALPCSENFGTLRLESDEPQFIDRRKPATEATDGIGGRREGDVNDVGMMLYRSEF